MVSGRRDGHQLLARAHQHRLALVEAEAVDLAVGRGAARRRGRRRARCCRGCRPAARSTKEPACSQTPASARRLRHHLVGGPWSGSASVLEDVVGERPDRPELGQDHQVGAALGDAPERPPARRRESTDSSGSTAIWMREARTLPPSWHSSRQHGPTIVTRKHCRGACSQRNLATEPPRARSPQPRHRRAARPPAPCSPAHAPNRRGVP